MIATTIAGCVNSSANPPKQPMNAVTSQTLVSKIQKAIWDAAGGLETIACETEETPIRLHAHQDNAVSPILNSASRNHARRRSTISRTATDQPHSRRVTELLSVHALQIWRVTAITHRRFNHSMAATFIKTFVGWRRRNLGYMAQNSQMVNIAASGWLLRMLRGRLTFRDSLFLFSPWTDFCLLCWDYYDCLKKKNGNLPEPGNPILIFGRDYYPLSHECVEANEDWGLNRMFCCNSSKPIFWGHYGILTHSTKCTDPSTFNLFKAIESAASRYPMGLEEYIGWKRILVYNVWPWFRCGQEVTGGKNIHSDFSRVPAVCDSASRIVDALKPSKIAALGEWSYWRGPSWLQYSSCGFQIRPVRHGSHWLFLPPQPSVVQSLGKENRR